MSISIGAALFGRIVLALGLCGTAQAARPKPSPATSGPPVSVRDASRALLAHNTTRPVACTEPAIVSAVLAAFGEGVPSVIGPNPSHAYVEALSREHDSVDMRDILADQPQCLVWTGQGKTRTLHGIRVLNVKGVEMVEIAALH